eukprot:jgi/Ulvmu1/4098/UM019_0077.1
MIAQRLCAHFRFVVRAQHDLRVSQAMLHVKPFTIGSVCESSPRLSLRAALQRCHAGQRPRPSPGNDPRMSTMPKQSAGSAESDVKVVKLEDATVEGVAKVDKEAGWVSDSGKVQLLIAGDLSALLLFAIIGRINHGEILDLDTLTTVLPFWLGWFASAPLLGGYRQPAQDGYVAPAAMTAVKVWAVATPIALVLRGLLKGYAPPAPFIAVAFGVTGVLMIGWRSALAAATTPWDQLSPLERFRKQKDKKGNAGEFMQLVMSLTKRW